MKSALALLACLLCCALALGACGGGDSDGSASANGGGDSAESATPESGSGEGGEASSDAPDSDSGSGATGDGGPQVPPAVVKAIGDGIGKGGYSAEQVKLAQFGEKGGEAVAVVQLIGRTLDGQSVEAVLSRGKKGWKLDELAKFVDFDKDQLVAKYKIETEILPEDFSPKVVRCLTKEFGKLPQSEMEAMYLDRDRSGFVALGQICISG